MSKAKKPCSTPRDNRGKEAPLRDAKGKIKKKGIIDPLTDEQKAKRKRAASVWDRPRIKTD